jgi:hypothetical protein
MSMRVLIIYRNTDNTRNIDRTYFYDAEVSDKDWEWMHEMHNRFFTECNAETACGKLLEWIAFGIQGKSITVIPSRTPVIADGFDYVLYTGRL